MRTFLIRSEARITSSNAWINDRLLLEKEGDKKHSEAARNPHRSERSLLSRKFRPEFIVLGEFFSDQSFRLIRKDKQDQVKGRETQGFTLQF